VGRASGTCGKTEDKSAAANATIPVFSRPNTVVYWSGPDHLMFRPPRWTTCHSACLYLLLKAPKRLPSVRAHRLVAGGGLQTVRRRASPGSVMGTPLGRPVPLPRRLPTAGDKLSFVRISIKEQAMVEKVFLG
jgi:hypothetical protein